MPYESNQAALLTQRLSKTKPWGYGYNLRSRFHKSVLAVKLQGLAPTRLYRLTEINLMPGQKSNLPANDHTYSGDYI